MQGTRSDEKYMMSLISNFERWMNWFALRPLWGWVVELPNRVGNPRQVLWWNHDRGTSDNFQFWITSNVRQVYNSSLGVICLLKIVCFCYTSMETSFFSLFSINLPFLPLWNFKTTDTPYTCFCSWVSCHPHWDCMISVIPASSPRSLSVRIGECESWNQLWFPGPIFVSWRL